METGRGKCCGKPKLNYIRVGLLSILWLLFFGLFLALGTASILVAKGQETTHDSNGVQVPNTTCDEKLNTTKSQSVRFTYWMAGACGCGVACALLGTILTCAIIGSVMATVQQTYDSGLRTKDHFGDHTMLRPRHREEEYIDELDGAVVYKATHVRLRQLDATAAIANFFGWLSLMCAILCLLWGVAIDYQHSSDEYQAAYPYILSEVLVGILLPILLFCFATVQSVVINYVTYGHVDARSAVTKFIPAVRFHRGKRYDYWSIVDYFYFPQVKSVGGKGERPRGATLWTACDKNRHTWCFAALVTLQLLLAISYFVDVNIAEQVAVRSCGDVPASGQYQCFERGWSFHFVQCSGGSNETAGNGTGTSTETAAGGGEGGGGGAVVAQQRTSAAAAVTPLDCFRFLQFGRDVSVIASLSQSFAFAMVTAVIFSHTFAFIKLLNRLKQSRLWGVVVVGVSLSLFAVALLILFAGNALLPRVEVIKTFQCVLVAAFIFTAGVLALEGKWWEKLPPSESPRPIQLKQQNENGECERMNDVPL